MSMIDINGLLSEISPDAPCGENLEYDADFSELERAARGRAEQTLGDASVAAEPPDWRRVSGLATALLGRTRDLRVAVYLTRALLNTNGLAGLAGGLALLHGLLERYWDCVHPQLDAEDDNDPTFRVNTLVVLCDRDAVLSPVLDAPLVNARGFGRFGLRDIRVARGELPPAEGAEAVELSAIEGAFMNSELEELEATAATAADCVRELEAIDAVLMERLGSAQTPDLGALSGTLAAIRTVLGEQLARRGIGEAPAAEEAAAAPAAARPASGEITSREDAIRMMDRISEYFQRHEPSSPIPMLMQRSKRLVSMSFMDILRDMAPDGVSQAARVGGVSED